MNFNLYLLWGFDIESLSIQISPQRSTVASPSGRSGLPVVRPVGQVLGPVLVLAPIHPPLGEGRTALVTQQRARIATNRSAVSIMYEAIPDPVPCSIFKWLVDSKSDCVDFNLYLVWRFDIESLSI